MILAEIISLMLCAMLLGKRYKEFRLKQRLLIIVITLAQVILVASYLFTFDELPHL